MTQRRVATVIPHTIGSSIEMLASQQLLVARSGPRRKRHATPRACLALCLPLCICATTSQGRLGHNQGCGAPEEESRAWRRCRVCWTLAGVGPVPKLAIGLLMGHGLW